MTVQIFSTEVHGVEVDPETRCFHYNSRLDVIAIRFVCCDLFYPCLECHAALADHAPAVWPAERFGEPVVLCGVCGYRLNAIEYFACGHTCPSCQAAFNPGCALHRDSYFERIEVRGAM